MKLNPHRPAPQPRHKIVVTPENKTRLEILAARQTHATQLFQESLKRALAGSRTEQDRLRQTGTLTTPAAEAARFLAACNQEDHRNLILCKTVTAKKTDDEISVAVPYSEYDEPATFTIPNVKTDYERVWNVLLKPKVDGFRAMIGGRKKAPFMANKPPPLETIKTRGVAKPSKHIASVEMIPSALWNKNVRRILSTHDWRTVRKAARWRAGGLCECCGLTDSSRADSFECHEVWDYNDNLRTQRLSGLLYICEECHEIKHIIRSKIVHGDEAYDLLVRKLAVYTEHTLEETERYIAKCQLEQKMRNNYSDWKNEIHRAFDSIRVDLRFSLRPPATPAGSTAAPWFVFAPDNILTGEVVGRYARPDDPDDVKYHRLKPISVYYQIKLAQPCAVLPNMDEPCLFEPAKPGDVVNVADHHTFSDWKHAEKKFSIRAQGYSFGLEEGFLEHRVHVEDNLMCAPIQRFQLPLSLTRGTIGMEFSPDY